MDQKSIIKQTVIYVKRKLRGESTGHDWWHTYRVWKMAVKIGKKEKGVDLFTVELASLLHDIADWKFHGGDDSIGPKTARKWLEKLKVDKHVVDHVFEIIKEVSFKGTGVKSKIKTKEGMVVQDADRLDALGAIGIARCFATGAKINVSIHNPHSKPGLYQTFAEYKKLKTTSINHFYEKLLLLKDLMNTIVARKIAEKRHKFTEAYLNRFLEEWKIED